MGSMIEFNDTLQISRKQGFPPELNLEDYLREPLQAKNFRDKIFEFKDKNGIRVFHAPPVRVFLVENKDGKWVYWGLIHVLEVCHDHEKNITSGKFKIIYLYTPEEMKIIHNLVDRNPQTNYFGN